MLDIDIKAYVTQKAECGQFEIAEGNFLQQIPASSKNGSDG